MTIPESTIRTVREVMEEFHSEVSQLKNELFYWMVQNADNRGELAYGVVGQAKEKLIRAIKRFDARNPLALLPDPDEAAAGNRDELIGLADVLARITLHPTGGFGEAREAAKAYGAARGRGTGGAG